jgi:nitroreductase
VTDYDILLKICESRKSERSFDDRPVPDEIIEKIKKIASTSPYASGKKNWGISVVTDKDILKPMGRSVEKKTSEMHDNIRPDMKEHFASYAKNFSFFMSAPCVFVLTFRVAPLLSVMVPDASEEILQWERDSYVKSISCVSMLILLAAESLGLGACYVTGALIAEKELRDILKIADGRSIGALVPIGYTPRTT